MGSEDNWHLIAEGEDTNLHKIIHCFGDLLEKTQVNIGQYIQTSDFYSSRNMEVDYNKWFGRSPQRLRNIDIKTLKNIKNVKVFQQKYPEYFI